jgi:hypothetical protein
MKKYLMYKIKYINLKKEMASRLNSHLGGSLKILIDKDNDDDQIEKLLSITEPLIINSDKMKYKYDYNYHISKGGRYGPYFCQLKDGNKLLYAFDYSNDNINIILQLITNYKIEDIGIFSRRIINNNNSEFVYSYNIEKISNFKNIDYQSHISELNNLNITKRIDLDKQIYKQININKIVTYITENKTLFLTGAGISYEIIPDLETIKKKILKVDSKDVFENSKNIIKLFTEWFDGMLNATPSIGHKMIKNICEKTHSGLITGNFDMLHQKSGIIPFRIQGHFNKYYEKEKKNNLKKIKLLIVIGYSIDILKQVSLFRNLGAIIIVFVYDKNNIPNFVESTDYVIFGDLHKNLTKLWKVIEFSELKDQNNM